MKKVFAILLMCFVCFACVGCSSATKLSSINTAFSSLYYAVDLRQLKIEELDDIKEEVVKNKVSNLASNYINAIKLRYYEQLNKLEIDGKISSNQNVIYKNHLTSNVSWKEGVCLIEVRFYSTTSSRLFVMSSDFSGTVNEEKTFSTVTSETFKHLFSRIYDNQVVNLGNYFTAGIQEVFTEIGEPLTENNKKEINFYYMISSENSRLHSKNADEVLNMNSGSLFCFYSLDEQEPEFEFYVVQANVLAYYLLALAIAFVFVAVYLVVLFILKKKKVKKIEMSDLNEDNFNDEES